MKLLDDLLSRDSQRIWSAACAVRKLRDAEQLRILTSAIDDIEAQTIGVDLGGALRRNASHLAFALKKLKFIRGGCGCLCGLYPLDECYNPEHEANAGNIRIEATTFQTNQDGTPSAYVDFHICACAICGARFRVEEREYHYTWWAWQKFDAGSPCPGEVTKK